MIVSHERQRWERSRIVVLLAVLALHVAVLTGLVIAAKTRMRTTPAAPPIELLILPQNPTPTIPPPPTLPDRRKKVLATPLAPAPDALTAVTPDSTSDVAGPPVDWSREAHNAAASIAKGAPAHNDTNPAVQSNSPFAAPPAHHKGEQIPTEDGRWIVYVTDDCYQVSKSMTSVTNATNNGMGLQTYCNRRSNKPRGDLFEQLPAYKKLHPDN
jgi:hypothetical protein